MFGLIDWLGWATFGFGATVMLTVTLVAAQLTGRTRMDLPMMLGSVFVGDPDRARFVGLFVHLLNGQVFALLYAGAFAAVGSATLWLGAAIGAVHGIGAMALLVPLLPGIHPRMASDMSGPQTTSLLEPPGLLALNYGRETPLITILAHIVYGGILGIFLSP